MGNPDTPDSVGGKNVLAATIVRHVCCDDAGTMDNPLLVEGQVHGGVASGIAQALVEEFHYDADGNPLTTNFMDYPLRTGLATHEPTQRLTGRSSASHTAAGSSVPDLR